MYQLVEEIWTVMTVFKGLQRKHPREEPRQSETVDAGSMSRGPVLKQPQH
jgi:hypothetical protein